MANNLKFIYIFISLLELYSLIFFLTFVVTPKTKKKRGKKKNMLFVLKNCTRSIVRTKKFDDRPNSFSGPKRYEITRMMELTLVMISRGKAKKKKKIREVYKRRSDPLKLEGLERY